MHQIYEVVPVLERLPLDIESLAAFDDNLVVGTKQGHLLMYNIASDINSDVQLLRSNKKFSTKPIVQVAVVPHHQILVSLSDNIVSIHDLTVYNFPLLATMSNTRGATTFDLEIRYHTSLTGESVVTVRLAVVVKRRVQLYYWKARKFHSLQDDVVLTDVPQSIGWCGGTLIVDQYAGYTKVELADGSYEVITKLDKAVEPKVLPTSSSSSVVLVMGPSQLKLYTTEPSQTTNTAGATQRTSSSSSTRSLPILPSSKQNNNEEWQPHPLTWSAAPSSIVYQDPFVIGIVNKNIEVVSVQDKLALQTININKPKLLVLAPQHSNKTSSCGDRRRVYCASSSHVWCLTGLSPSQQLPGLLDSRHYGLALRLLEMWGDQEKDDTTRSHREHIQKLLAFQQFCNQRFQEALDSFLDIDTELLFVIGLFPDLVPEDCLKRLQYPHPPPVLKPPQLQAALSCLIDYLLKKRQRLVSSLDKLAKRSDIINTPRAGKKRNALTQQLQVVDTTLLKCYLQERPGLVGPLLRMPDSRVSLVEGERLLREHQRLPDFLLLLRARGLHSKALTLLHHHQHTTEPSALKGPQSLVDYLQNMGLEHTDLIFKNMDWLTLNHPLEALKVLTGSDAPISDAEQISRIKVVEFLVTRQPRLAIIFLEHAINEWNDNQPDTHDQLLRLYCDFVVQETDKLNGVVTPLKKNAVTSTDQPERSINSSANSTSQNNTPVPSPAHVSQSTTNLLANVARASISSNNSHLSNSLSLSCLDQASSDSSSNTNNSFNKTNPMLLVHMKCIGFGGVPHPDLAFDLATIRRKLLQFLHSSTRYRAPQLLLYFPHRTCLLPARAVLLCRIGEHRQALKLYISDMHDLPAALHYCHLYYKNTGPASQVYLMLLELLVQCEDVHILLLPRHRDLALTENFVSPSAAVENSSKEDIPSCIDSNGSVCPEQSTRGNSALPSKESRRDAQQTESTTVKFSVDGTDYHDSGRSSQSSNNDRPLDESKKFELLLQLLLTHSKHIRLKPAMQLLPDSLRVQELKQFLQSWMRQYSSQHRKMILQRGAAQAVHKQVAFDLSVLQCNKIALSTQKMCCICNKRLTKFSAFVCSPSGAVCHFSCRERLQSSWLKEVQEARDKQAVEARNRAAMGSSSRASTAHLTQS